MRIRANILLVLVLGIGCSSEHAGVPRSIVGTNSSGVSNSKAQDSTPKDQTNNSGSTATNPASLPTDATGSCPAGSVPTVTTTGASVCAVATAPTGSTTPTGSTAPVAGATSTLVTTTWLLDRDCLSEANAGVPAANSSCRNLTTMTCPENPTGLKCTTVGVRCVTPVGFRRFVCR